MSFGSPARVIATSVTTKTTSTNKTRSDFNHHQTTYIFISTEINCLPSITPPTAYTTTVAAANEFHYSNWNSFNPLTPAFNIAVTDYRTRMTTSHCNRSSIHALPKIHKRQVVTHLGLIIPPIQSITETQLTLTVFAPTLQNTEQQRSRAIKISRPHGDCNYTSALKAIKNDAFVARL